MSGSSVILEASKKLQELIVAGLNEADGAPPANNAGQIQLTNPADLPQLDGTLFSLWLYRVIENGFQKNVPPVRTDDPEVLRPPPLALELYYLLTPFGGQEETRQQLLGQVMRKLHDEPIVPLTSGNPDDVREQLHIQLFRMSLEELTRIWEALTKPFRLSVVYQVRVVRLSSRREVRAGRVRDRHLKAPDLEDAVP
jgi:hypothetical protein